MDMLTTIGETRNAASFYVSYIRDGGYEREISPCVVFQGPEIKSQSRD